MTDISVTCLDQIDAKWKSGASCNLYPQIFTLTEVQTESIPISFSQSSNFWMLMCTVLYFFSVYKKYNYKL